MSQAVDRVVDRATFRALAASQLRASSNALTVRFVPSAGGRTLRVAYSVPRAVGGAVVRNRLRRRLRAAVRELSDTMEPGAYLVITGPAAASASYGVLKNDLSRLLRQANAARR